MKKHNINLNTFLTKGSVVTEIKDDMLHMTTTRRLHENINIYLPEPYKVPLRIDLTIKIDSPGLYLFFGNGHISFGTPWSDSRRIDDIIEPNSKTRFFHNHVPMNEFVNISVIYDFKAMQILINDEERFYSEKEKYMKSKLFKEFNDRGFTLKMACDKRADLIIKSLSITEYDETAEIMRTDIDLPAPLKCNQAIQPGQKPQFEACISLLAKEIQNEIIKTDHYLRSLKPMKFKRQVDKYGNKITYIASEYGFSYALYPSNDVMHHSLSWYIITGCKPELWYRKADMMEETLNKLAEASPEFAERMFLNLKECNACCQCAVKTLYEFNGKKKVTCHGRMEFKMCVSDFGDVRGFINTVNELISHKIN
jgi:hypothetical protein